MELKQETTVECLDNAFRRLAERCALSEDRLSDDLDVLLREVQRLRYFEHEVARLLGTSPCYAILSTVRYLPLSEHAPVPGAMD